MASEAEPTEQDPGRNCAGTEPRAKAPWGKLLGLAGGAAVLLVIAYLSPLRGYLGHVQEVSGRIQQLGWLAPLAVTFGVAVLVAVGFPRLLLCGISGMAMGFWWGLLWAQLGTLLGNYAFFLAARLTGGDWVRQKLSRQGKVFLVEEGIAGVILARQLPVPGPLINLACGLCEMRHRDYLLGTLLGQLPEAVPCTLIGAGIIGQSLGSSLSLVMLAAAVAVAGWVILRWFLRKHRNTPPGTTPPRP